MPIKRVTSNTLTNMHFLTLTVYKWYYVFDRRLRWRILLSSLEYCQEHKGVKVFAYVFMLNHIHLIVSAPDVSGFLRDFKRHTTRRILEDMRENEPSALSLFAKPDGTHYFWQTTNMPVAIESEAVFLQKKTYIEQDPVHKEYVAQPEHWQYSSAFIPNLLHVSTLDEL